MKGFSRFTAMVLSLAIAIVPILSVNAVADTVTFTDVSADYQYNQAIYSLVSNGIINGYTEEDGTSTFKPENTITRAEFAKLLVLATTTGVTHTATTNIFPDLTLEHWANTYIAAAVNTGAINGYEDGTFRPENPVSYGEAVKMIVCTLGYASIVTPTEPWYDGYIKMANSIGLTKGAVGLGTNQAKRGLVAQLIYNIENAKQLIQIGTDASGNPIYNESSKKDNENYEQYRGIVTGVFETTLEGISYNLNKQQIMIDDEVFYIGQYSIEKFMPYLGKSISIKYEDGSKKTITSFEEDRNNEITVKDFDIEEVNGREITYYEGNDKEELTLSSDLYVIYNGIGVERELIDDDFIEKYLNVESGEITLLNNDSKSDYDVAFVTSYETMFVTSRSVSNGSYTIFDSKGSVGSITLKDNDCTVYTVSAKGGAKTEVESLSSISANSVISIAAPLDRTEGTEVIISSIKLTGKELEAVSKYYYTIGGDDYEISSYYEDLIAEDSLYDLQRGASGTFYFDYLGRLVYYTKSETSDTYGYLVALDGSTGLNSKYVAYIFTQSGSWLNEYPIASNIKINGSRCTPSEAAALLRESAAVINEDKPSEMTVNAEYAQVIKYRTNSNNEISEIMTINPENISDGDIVPGVFNSDNDADTSKTAFSIGEKFKYTKSGYVFKDSDGSSQFALSSSTIVFMVPYDRSEQDDYKKRNGSQLTDGGSYIVEPYDMSSTTAKVAVIYSTTGSVGATITAATKPVFIEYISEAKNKKGEYADKIVYYTAGSTTKSTIFASDKVDLEALGIGAGDVVKFAVENSEVVGVQRVFVGGALYDWELGDVFTTTIDDDNHIMHARSSQEDYYEVIYGKAFSKTEVNDQIAITPVGGSSWSAYSVDDSTKFYAWDSDNEAYTTEKTMDDITTVEKSSEAAATEVVAIKMDDTLLAVYILE